jgi:hypothetical protein
MRIYNVTPEQIEDAVEYANGYLDGNIFFQTTAVQYRQNGQVKYIQGQLKVVSRKGLGAALTPSYKDRSVWRANGIACGHAHGLFFDGLPPATKVQSKIVDVYYSGSRWQPLLEDFVSNPRWEVTLGDCCDCREQDLSFPDHCFDTRASITWRNEWGAYQPEFWSLVTDIIHPPYGEQVGRVWLSGEYHSARINDVGNWEIDYPVQVPPAS